jgi:LPPG:FO 2-phospho-L-lactate transferase
VVQAIEQAELILICPSNPFISIWPILAVADIREAIETRRVPSVAISPLVGGRAIKGPADRMLERLAGGTNPGRVASCYAQVADALVFDESDARFADRVEAQGMRPIVTQTLMRDESAATALAEAVLASA